MQNNDSDFIIKYIDSFVLKNKCFYIVMQLAETDLYQLIRHQRNTLNSPFSQQSTKGWFIQILCGLKHLHDESIMHRDLKPPNILVKKKQDKEGDVFVMKLSDFGLSRQLGPNEEFAHTLCGTKIYMAPEMDKKTKEYKISADIWSAGCVLYEIWYLFKIQESDVK